MPKSKMSQVDLSKIAGTLTKELMKFLAILMMMCMNKLPPMRLYWSKNKLYGNDLVKKVMIPQSFSYIAKMFAFC